MRSAPGVVQADTYLEVGETIRPVRLDADRRGYVVAIADTNLEALRRAEIAASLVEVTVEPTTGDASPHGVGNSYPAVLRVR